MVTLLLAVFLPAVGLLILGYGAKLYKGLFPSPVPIGCIIPKVCIVGSIEILRYNQRDEEEKPVAKHLRREVRWKQFRVNWGYLFKENWNTMQFQRAVTFEKMKIDPTKSSLEYEQREILTLELVDETANLRWALFRAQVNLLYCLMLRLSIDKEAMIELLGRYKRLEEDIVAWAGMADDDRYRTMLMERLGLNNWGLIDGGSSDAY